MIPTGDGTTVELELLVPTGGRAVSLLWVVTPDRTRFIAAVRDYPEVTAVAEVKSFEDRSLIALEWDIESDRLFRGIAAANTHVLHAVGAGGSWLFSVRFPTREYLAGFRRHCEGEGIGFEVETVFSATRPDVGSGYGVTARQREVLLLAVEWGYYAIPRETGTADLAARLGISKQSVTERLRRGTANLVRNTLGGSEYDR